MTVWFMLKYVLLSYCMLNDCVVLQRLELLLCWRLGEMPLREEWKA